MTDAELVARARSLQPHIVDMFEQHVWASLGASTGPGILGAILGAFGRPDDTVRLLTGIGGVDSADIGRALWLLSREVRRSPELAAAYDQGLGPARIHLEFGRAPARRHFHPARSRRCGPGSWRGSKHSACTSPVTAGATPPAWTSRLSTDRTKDLRPS